MTDLNAGQGFDQPTAQPAPDERRIARTEQAFTSPHWNRTDRGLYHCSWCRRLLFDSSGQLDWGAGLPGFGPGAGVL